MIIKKMTMNIDKQNGDVCFNEATHRYFNINDPQKRYISVTTLIHKFEPPFDKDFWSAYKAVEQIIQPDYWKYIRKDLLAVKACTPKLLESYDISIDDFNKVQQNILDGWQKEGFAATQRGTELHANLENSFYAQGTDISLQKYGVGGKFTCVKGKTDFDLENGLYPEYLIHYESNDGKLCLAGQIDLLAKEGNQFSIIDWKGLPLNTKIPTITGWTTMGDIKVGDKVFDCEGKACAVIHKSEIHNNPCLKITFTSGESIVADEDHRWKVSTMKADLLCQPYRVRDDVFTRVMTTKEIKEYLKSNKEEIITIDDPIPFDGPIKGLPYTFPATNETTLELLKKAMRASWRQRMDIYHTAIQNKYVVARNMSKEGFYEIKKGPLAETIAEFVTTLGFRVHKNNPGEYLFSICPPYRIIKKVTKVKSVPTQCIEVDSWTHTYLCTEMLLVTHNTNKQIKTSSYYNQTTKKSEKLQYPLNDLDNCNYNTYNMQLSTYAWMVEQLHPEWKCKDLVLVHFDHNNNMTTYAMEYLKDHVEKMLTFWKKQSVLDQHREQRQRIKY